MPTIKKGPSIEGPFLDYVDYYGDKVLNRYSQLCHHSLVGFGIDRLE